MKAVGNCITVFHAGFIGLKVTVSSEITGTVAKVSQDDDISAVRCIIV